MSILELQLDFNVVCVAAPELTGNSSVASLSLAANKQQFKPLSSIPRRNSIYSIAPSQVCLEGVFTLTIHFSHLIPVDHICPTS